MRCDAGQRPSGKPTRLRAAAGQAHIQPGPRLAGVQRTTGTRSQEAERARPLRKARVPLAMGGGPLSPLPDRPISPAAGRFEHGQRAGWPAPSNPPGPHLVPEPGRAKLLAFAIPPSLWKPQEEAPAPPALSIATGFLRPRQPAHQ